MGRRRWRERERRRGRRKGEGRRRSGRGEVGQDGKKQRWIREGENEEKK